MRSARSLACTPFCYHRAMDPFLAGFADELVKTATPLITIPATLAGTAAGGAAGVGLARVITDLLAARARKKNRLWKMMGSSGLSGLGEAIEEAVHGIRNAGIGAGVGGILGGYGAYRLAKRLQRPDEPAEPPA